MNLEKKDDAPRHYPIITASDLEIESVLSVLAILDFCWIWSLSFQLEHASA